MSHRPHPSDALEARVADLERLLSIHHSLGPTGLPRRRLAAVLVALVLLVPSTVLASHQFGDVPNENTFHNAINAIARAGVTAGCGSGNYCPDEAVTRGQMAAFMQRSSGRAGMRIGGPLIVNEISVNAGSSGTTNVAMRELTISVPGSSNDFNPNQLVLLFGHVQFFTAMNSAKGCPCNFSANIRDVTTDTIVVADHGQGFAATDQTANYSFSVIGLVPAAPGPRTYRLEARLSGRASTINPAAYDFSFQSSITALTFPFGPQGTNTNP